MVFNTGGYPIAVIGNHDVIRDVTRHIDGERAGIHRHLKGGGISTEYSRERLIDGDSAREALSLIGDGNISRAVVIGGVSCSH